jgi:hypothetical protein
VAVIKPDNSDIPVLAGKKIVKEKQAESINDH